MAKVKIIRDYSPTPLHRLMFILQHLSDELLEEEAGIGLSHVRILGTLDSKVPRSQRYIASRLRQTEANVSRQLRAMHKDGLVKVTKNNKDSRQRDVSLTTKGANKYAKAEQLLKKQLDQVYKPIKGWEKKQFNESVAKLNASL